MLELFKFILRIHLLCTLPGPVVVMEVVDDRLRSLKKQLKNSLSLESFQKYILLVESVINGRISKAESDMILSDLIPSELRRTSSICLYLCMKPIIVIALHNQYIISVLEKVSDIESTIKAKQEPTITTASLDPRIITLTKQERNALIDSLARLPIVHLHLIYILLSFVHRKHKKT